MAYYFKLNQELYRPNNKQLWKIFSQDSSLQSSTSYIQYYKN